MIRTSRVPDETASQDWQIPTETGFKNGRDNGTKANLCLCADILGDWREEVIWRTRDNRELRIFSTTVPTNHWLPRLMHDPLYRLSVGRQNVGFA